jgi:voltage-gated sodium channel
MASFLKGIADAKWFQNFIIAAILAAGVLVGIQTYEFSSPAVRGMMGRIDFFDQIILWIFVVEIGIKMGGEGSRPWRYFLDPWNIFDFIIVAVCFLPFNAEYAAVLRLLRLLRVLKLVRALPRLQVLVGALLRSIPSMAYVSILLLLLFYVYACGAVFIFGENDPVHFGHLPISMLSLFRVVTGEDWTDVMYIAMHGCQVYDLPQSANYFPDTQTLVNFYGPGQDWVCSEHSQAMPVFAALFFVSFMLIGAMVILNLFIGVIMTGMEEADLEVAREAAIAAEAAGGPSRDERIGQLLDELDGIRKELSELTG